MVKRKWALVVAIICTIYAPYTLYKMLMIDSAVEPAYRLGEITSIIGLPVFFYFLAFYKKKK
ncbi:hypothetical protein [Streptococcus massiliensis]|uniref:Uncharacterized protein n=1 Tax=Streptococcus massiliensis TaxID=313439 RepID=A0A380KY25_9STRE|nr:hypothetical protein [Streptococcus massiliensis]SUN76608.1 Uncharacterised protein [Streptococcus massiliensis]